MSRSEGLEGEIDNAAKHVVEHVNDAKQALITLDQRVIGFVKERPGTCILAALATGFVLGRMGGTQRRSDATDATQSMFAAGLSAALRAAAVALINNRVGAALRSDQ
ncbi:MAG TPA: hypothetical protein VIV60_06730 [Polyangiaceae bacterium]